MNHIDDLYLIGNGFDMHHELACGYSDFHNWLRENNPMLENRLFQIYDFHNNGSNGVDLWSSLENNLGKISVEAILEGYVYAPMMLFITYTNGKKSAINMDDFTESVGEIGLTLKRLYNGLQEEFTNWILQLDNPDTSQKVKINKDNAKFISFNYTQTLERVYSVSPSNILYIHGCAAKNDNLVFGHNMTRDKLLENWENNYCKEELVALINAADEMSILYKDVYQEIEKNGSFWQTIKKVKTIHVWGLSLSEVDTPYIKHINSMVNHDNTQWEFSWFSESDKNRIEEVVVDVGITRYSLVKLEVLAI